MSRLCPPRVSSPRGAPRGAHFLTSPARGPSGGATAYRRPAALPLFLSFLQSQPAPSPEEGGDERALAEELANAEARFEALTAAVVEKRTGGGGGGGGGGGSASPPSRAPASPRRAPRPAPPAPGEPPAAPLPLASAATDAVWAMGGGGSGSGSRGGAASSSSSAPSVLDSDPWAAALAAAWNRGGEEDAPLTPPPPPPSPPPPLPPTPPATATATVAKQELSWLGAVQAAVSAAGVALGSSASAAVEAQSQQYQQRRGGQLQLPLPNSVLETVKEEEKSFFEKLAASAASAVAQLASPQATRARADGERLAAKAALLIALSPLGRGASATAAQKRSVEALASALCELNPTPNPTESALSDGAWNVVFTTSSDLLVRRAARRRARREHESAVA